MTDLDNVIDDELTVEELGMFVNMDEYLLTKYLNEKIGSARADFLIRRIKAANKKIDNLTENTASLIEKIANISVLFNVVQETVGLLESELKSADKLVKSIYTGPSDQEIKNFVATKGYSFKDEKGAESHPLSSIEHEEVKEFLKNRKSDAPVDAVVL